MKLKILSNDKFIIRYKIDLLNKSKLINSIESINYISEPKNKKNLVQSKKGKNKETFKNKDKIKRSKSKKKIKTLWVRRKKRS